MKRKTELILFFATLGFLFPAFAETTIHGHIKTQGTHSDADNRDIISALGPDSTTDLTFDSRLNAEGVEGPMRFEIHAEGLATSGDRARLRKRASQLLTSTNTRRLPTDRQRLFSFTETLVDERSNEAVVRLDRLNIGYSDGKSALKIGRQATSWGNGLIFQVSDVFNPFSPIEIDKDYKTGEDMVTGSVSVGDIEAQFLALPRRDENHSIMSNSSSFATKLRTQFEDLEVDAIAAEHYDDTLFGFGSSSSIFDAVFRTDAMLTNLVDGGNRFSFLANLDRTWEMFGKNTQTMIEYFHNGFGVDEDSYARPPGELQSRISRGELFTSGKDYVAAAIRIEWEARFQFQPLALFNLHDESSFLQLTWLLDIAEDCWINMGMNFPFGPKGSEFGGYELAPGGPSSPHPVEGFVRLAYFY